MGVVKLLGSNVYNKIAAGEVIERPASVVKELVENSIDAGASRVEIIVKGCGTELIEVADNGGGIEEDDVDLIFMKHATSKLREADDLFDVKTFGFRGEALASIAAVSYVTLTTRTPFSETALRVNVADGNVADKQYCSAGVGTRISVADLFYNTPARKKFLKTDSREAAEITQYVSRLMLTNPLLEVRYVLNDKEIYHFMGSGVEEAIYTIYGKECLDNCLPINSKYDDILVRGYIGSPEYTKSNSTYQTFSVNGRYIKDAMISSAVKQAFAPFLMTRCFPFCVLDVSLPADYVDVNVHPAKLEVRFADYRKVFVAVNVPIKNMLRKFSQNRVDDILSKKSKENYRVDYEKPEKTPSNMLADAMEERFYRNQLELSDKEKEIYRKMEMENSQKQYRQFLRDINKVTVEDDLRRYKIGKFAQEQDNAVLIKPSEFKEPEPVQQKLFDDDEFDFSTVKILGTLFNTYLVMQKGDDVVFIDQHAAHERLLYDKFLKDGYLHDMQQVLFPYVFTVSEDEDAFIKENMEEIRAAGFGIEQFGEKVYRISEVSLLFVDVELKKFVSNLLSSIDEFRLDSNKLTKEVIAKKACRAAVKGGEILADTDLEYIVKEVCKNKAFQCPHGRPISVLMTKTQIEKMFKRIV